MVTKIGDRIRTTREERGLSKSLLAGIVGVSPTAVWNWEENGVTPRGAMVSRIARALGVTDAFLLTGQRAAPTLRTAAEIIDNAADQIAALNGVPKARVKITWQIVS